MDEELRPANQAGGPRRVEPCSSSTRVAGPGSRSSPWPDTDAGHCLRRTEVGSADCRQGRMADELR
jgi:hypothetical protein